MGIISKTIMNIKIASEMRKEDKERKHDPYYKAINKPPKFPESKTVYDFNVVTIDN